MKKIIILIAITALLIGGLWVIKNRMSSGKQFGGGGDLVIVNDSQDTASSAFTQDGKMVSQVMHPGERSSGGRGLIRVFIAKKGGAYEIQYPFPRPVGKPSEISLTQIFAAVHNPMVDDELIVEKGKIADIRVDYEEVRDLDATY